MEPGNRTVCECQHAQQVSYVCFVCQLGFDDAILQGCLIGISCCCSELLIRFAALPLTLALFSCRARSGLEQKAAAATREVVQLQNLVATLTAQQLQSRLEQKGYKISCQCFDCGNGPAYC